MFSKADKRDPKVARPGAAVAKAAPSIISAGLEVQGNLVTRDDVQIDGRVVGDIASGKLTVGDKAVVEGEINADEVTVKGEVKGCIRAATVVLAKSARVTGDILHTTLSIEPGAQLEGLCKHMENPQGLDESPLSLVPKGDPAKPLAADGGTETASAD